MPPLTSAQPTGKRIGQQANRRAQFWKDQHGRRWHSTVDFKDVSQAPASPLYPVGWEAPIEPPQQYLRAFDANTQRYGEIEVHYDQWLADTVAAWREREEAKDRYSQGLAGGDPDMHARLMARPTPALMGMLGREPLHPNYVKACMAGDQWALGLAKLVPPWAARLWPDGIVNPARRPTAVDMSFLDDDGVAREIIQQAVRRPRGRPRKRALAPAPTGE